MKSWAKRLSDHNLKVTVVQCCNWPQQCSPLSTVFDLVKQVSEYFQHIWRIQTVQEHQAVSRKKWIWNSLGWWRKSEARSGGKRISHSCCWSQRWKSGQWNQPEVKKQNVFRQAATFCNLMSLWHQLEFEGCVDVFQLARLYHYSRSQKVSYERWYELWNPSQTTSSFLLSGLHSFNIHNLFIFWENLKWSIGSHSPCCLTITPGIVSQRLFP